MILFFGRIFRSLKILVGLAPNDIDWVRISEYKWSMSRTISNRYYWKSKPRYASAD